MKNIKKKVDAIREELKEPIPEHQSTTKEKKRMATKKKGRKASKKKSKKVTKKIRKKGKSKKVSKKKAAAGGTTLAELAKEAGISGQKARQKLRAAGVEREKGSRWVFSSKSELKAARKALGL